MFAQLIQVVYRPDVKQHFSRNIVNLVLLALTLGDFSTSSASAASTVPIRKPVAKSPTFSEHVAPILFENCVSCHRPGEAAPFSLITYQDVRKRAQRMVEATSTKFMPPWHAELGHVELANPRILSAEQIATLHQWYERGMPEGDPARLPKLPSFPEGWQLGKPDLIVKMDRPYKVRAEGRDVYRHFVLPLNFTEDKWVRAIEFRPSAPTVVHHALFFLDPSGAARNLETNSEAGFSGHGRITRNFTPIGGWALGSNVRALPDGLAYLYPKGADFVLQTHFHPSGKEEEEVSTVGIFFADQPPKQSFVGIQLPPAFGEISGIDIPAGSTNYLVKDSFTLPVDAKGFAISAHAHYLGKTMTMKATLPDGREQVLLNIPDWDFAWQEQYTFKDRLVLPKGTRIDVSLIYDNSATNPHNPVTPPVRVRWGPMSNDEMGSITLQVVPAREDDVAELRTALRNHSANLVIDRALANPKPPPMVKTMMERFDTNADGKLDDKERNALIGFVQASGLVPGHLNNSF
ncbi:MAG: hypothetical protein H7X97_01315 [Opitutaceae bacterium]|nr:hypothetical protein [Verrucomicrobiales bacterium]